MKKAARKNHFMLQHAGKYIFAAALIMSASPLQAQELDPFQTDPSTWKSFDRYKEEQRQSVIDSVMGAPKSADAPQAAPAADAKPADKTADAKTTDAKAVDGAPALAAPEKPLMPPVMPALTKNDGATIPVGTTEDDAKPVAHVINMEDQPDLQLPKSDWTSVKQAEVDAQDRDNDDSPPIRIRMSPLPSLKPQPRHVVTHTAANKVPSILDPRRPELQSQAQAQSAPQQSTPVAAQTAETPKPADPAECAAIDAYKKRQLEAIQSDRRTLMALQAAITELGLQKKLNFMAGGKSKINTPGDGSITEATAGPPSTAKP